ncbi:hypothetical protein LCGC14_2533620 [marine sediment metagenome]|uniref:Uncharacterized protein n=1 Tax=marine sediment metagenome TaxID=412755 RepID=A0A0F9BFN9_9ZZZZ
MTEDYTRTNPLDHTLVSAVPDEIRNVKALVIGDSAASTGGAARIFFQAAAPTVRYDGSAFDASDNGSLWIDSDDNHIYFLTAFAGPTWTDYETIIEAMLLVMARSNVTLTLKNTDNENSNGGRDSSLRFQGLQDGNEVTTLAAFEVSHEGTADDEKGKISIKVNDGDDGDSPSKEAIAVASTGIPTLLVGALLSASTAPTADAMVSNKKYRDDFGVRTNEDDESNAMLVAHAYLANQAGTVIVVHTSVGIGSQITGYVDTDNNPAAGGTVVMGFHSYSAGIESSSFPVESGKYFEVTLTGGTALIYWQPNGTLIKCSDQD